ncbi:MAG TPA: hypothetical protein VHT91_31800 [Kofleriaceae bacterium]|nr:hypothetical protein [Kofleriaceae bacterium]
MCSGGETCSSCPDDCGAHRTVCSYTCGYALPNFGCDNGRTHADITAPGMTTAIATCHVVQPPDRPDSCYVIDASGAAAADESDCTAASASWRSGNSCCNFFGTLSCPNWPNPIEDRAPMSGARQRPPRWRWRERKARHTQSRP